MRGMRTREWGPFSGRKTRREQDEEPVIEFSSPHIAAISSRLAYLALLDRELLNGDEDEVVESEYEETLNYLQECSPHDLADAIRELNIIEVLEQSVRDDPSAASMVELFKGILQDVKTDTQSVAERLLSKTPKGIRAGIGAAVVTAATWSSTLPAAAIDDMNNTALVTASNTNITSSTTVFDGSSEQTIPAVVSAASPEAQMEQLPSSQQTTDVIVFGATGEELTAATPEFAGSDYSPLASDETSSGLVRVFEKTAEGVVDVTSRFNEASKPTIPDQKNETVSSIAEFLGIETPDVFAISNTNQTHPELNVAPTHPAKVSVMSYNILGAKAAITHRNGGGYSWLQRLRAATSVIKDENPSIIGLQEVDAKQFRVLQRELSDTYDSYPAKYVSGAKRPIFWQASEFDLIDKGMYKIDRYGNPKTLSPWVKLRAKDGQEFYMYNIHMSAGGAKDARKYGGGKTNVPPPKQRAKQAGQLIAAINRTNKEDLPALITGDFNSTCEKTSRDGGVPFQKIPCVQLQNADFLDAGVVTKAEGTAKNAAYSTSHLKAGKERRTGGRHIDRIMGTKKGVKFMEWKNVVEDEDVEIAGDHTPVVSEVIVGDPVDLIDEN